MRVHIATDHAGFELKNELVAYLNEKGITVADHGYHEYDRLDAYPPVCIACAKAVAADPGSLGIVIGGSGNGEQISANKVAGIRAALVWNEEIAMLAREHNNANVMSIGARQHSVEEVKRFVDVFIGTEYDAASRHQSRIEMISDFENQRNA
ncbi:ribose-5-phosphate isomerase [Arcanobacterium hippocoleae]|uniref:Ribose-5-phosphate isomerase B n=1 Tax=Arcanobacterium hippocoleae TaxID=149017 RepID=A0ABU1T1L2_9ACTO|nr:ribose-5-phosphate isomerase [Arcanobacterium hippocoleae]MDR6939155.1 ribose 5-phosphate isomerase B [Arcanobacterium hippocoleae]